MLPCLTLVSFQTYSILEGGRGMNREGGQKNECESQEGKSKRLPSSALFTGSSSFLSTPSHVSQHCFPQVPASLVTSLSVLNSVLFRPTLVLLPVSSFPAFRLL